MGNVSFFRSTNILCQLKLYFTMFMLRIENMLCIHVLTGLLVCPRAFCPFCHPRPSPTNDFTHSGSLPCLCPPAIVQTYLSGSWVPLGWWIEVLKTNSHLSETLSLRPIQRDEERRFWGEKEQYFQVPVQKTCSYIKVFGTYLVCIYKIILPNSYSSRMSYDHLEVIPSERFPGHLLLTSSMDSGLLICIFLFGSIFHKNNSLISSVTL